MSKILEQAKILELKGEKWEGELELSGLSERTRELLGKALRAHIAKNHNYPRISEEEFDVITGKEVFFVRLYNGVDGDASLVLEMKGQQNNRHLFLKEEK